MITRVFFSGNLNFFENQQRYIFFPLELAKADTLSLRTHAGNVGSHYNSLTSLYCSKKSKTTSKSSWRGEFWSDNQMDSDSLLQMTCCTGPMRCCFRPRKTERISTQKDYPCRPVSRTHQLSATSHG